MRVLIVIIFLIFPGILISANAKDLKDKAIICKEINNEFKSMYGFKFVDLDHVRVLIKNSDTVDVLTDNILTEYYEEDRFNKIKHYFVLNKIEGF